ncbi:hypothetical protein [Aquipuribacter nitratireducens]|uniref:NTP pyrophosphohydrolase n=1 Tax=Aquipuribacter nitratireducens TaxID=650104 RepID=A0ABW0GPN4_9MICO
MLVVDVANMVGSRPDGWWRDRSGATRRLLERLVAAEPALGPVVAVVEGAARDVEVPDEAAAAGVTVVRASGSGDDAVVAVSAEHPGATVVTADRGLRARLAAGTPVEGPGRLLGLLDG